MFRYNYNIESSKRKIILLRFISNNHEYDFLKTFKNAIINKFVIKSWIIQIKKFDSKKVYIKCKNFFNCFYIINACWKFVIKKTKIIKIFN